MSHCSYEQSHFTVDLSGKTGFWWIGLRAQGNINGGVDYKWDNGSPVTFTHWDKDQPGTTLKPNADSGISWAGRCLFNSLDHVLFICPQIAAMVPVWP